MTLSWGRAGAEDTGGALDRYAYAYLAGGGRRVAESAVVALTEQGALSLRAGRLRPTGDGVPAAHAVEHAVIAACPRSTRVREVTEAVGRSQPVDDIARRLVRLGLLGGRRRRTTRAGRRLLAAAASEGTLPGYVLHGPTALATGPIRHGLLGAHPAPDGLGRTLRRMGKALDDDHGPSAEAAPGGGHGCGGSSGGD
ncbi:TIGR04222 domain-containing membrane protein [Streptomyces griseus]|uniref:TIGR04222 domain-containing membrane protein n=1 Tax=Streptomyces griseus TaxID=1911 RepID=UPI00380AFFEC